MATPTPKPVLATIGYERAALPDFIQTLLDAGVQLLIDVRERPFSRRGDFSRDALSAALAQAGIDYRSERDLGAPPPIRKLAREEQDYDGFFHQFREHLAGQEDVLRRVAEGLGTPTALMCYERDPEQCHRKVVAERLAEIGGVDVQHLLVEPQPFDGHSPK